MIPQLCHHKFNCPISSVCFNMSTFESHSIRYKRLSSKHNVIHAYCSAQILMLHSFAVVVVVIIFNFGSFSLCMWHVQNITRHPSEYNMEIMVAPQTRGFIFRSSQAYIWYIGMTCFLKGNNKHCSEETTFHTGITNWNRSFEYIGEEKIASKKWINVWCIRNHVIWLIPHTTRWNWNSS